MPERDRPNGVGMHGIGSRFERTLQPRSARRSWPTQVLDRPGSWFVDGQSLDGDTVQLERAGRALPLPLLTPSAFDGLTGNELFSSRLVDLATADALARMRTAAGQGGWAAVDHMQEDARRQFAGNGGSAPCCRR